MTDHAAPTAKNETGGVGSKGVLDENEESSSSMIPNNPLQINHNDNNNNNNNNNNNTENHQKKKKNNNNSPTATTNFIIMSDAGKPIFALHGKEDEIARICGLFQAIRTSLLYNSTLNDLGDIQSLRSNDNKTGSWYYMVFMTVGAITLMAISSSSSKNNNSNNNNNNDNNTLQQQPQQPPSSVHEQHPQQSETEAYLRLKLEYLYAQIIFNMSDHVQTAFQHNASFDLSSMLRGTASNVMRTVLEKMATTTSSSSSSAAAPFLVASITPVFPISLPVREHTSHVLQVVGEETEHTIFAILFTTTTCYNNIMTTSCDNTTATTSSSDEVPKLITLVQPNYYPHQLRSSDLHILLEFINRQYTCNTKSSSSSELWFPACLPRFNSTGFVNCYTQCLSTIVPTTAAAAAPPPPPPSTSTTTTRTTTTNNNTNHHHHHNHHDTNDQNNHKLILALVSQHGTTEQFEAFQRAAVRIRRGLNIPTDHETVLEIFQHHDDNEKDVQWKRNTVMDDNHKKNTNDIIIADTGSDELIDGFVHISEEEVNNAEQLISDISFGNTTTTTTTAANNKGRRGEDFPLLSELALAHNESFVQSKIKEYMDDEILHFIFRLDESIKMSTIAPSNSRGRRKQQQQQQHQQQSQQETVGHLTQCIYSNMDLIVNGNKHNSDDDDDHHHDDDNDNQRQQLVWSMYQRLHLRLRLGSAIDESIHDAFDMILSDAKKLTSGKEGHHTTTPPPPPATIGKHCPAMVLAESPPNIQGITYVAEGKDVFLGMNGTGFELYLVADRSVPIKIIAAKGARLVRRLMVDQSTLFLMNPRTWRE